MFLYYLLLILVFLITTLVTTLLWELYKRMTRKIRETHERRMFFVDLAINITIIVVCIAYLVSIF